MGRVIAISNHKGGTTKTTSCACLGVALTELGRRVLALDLDPQAGLSSSLGVDIQNLKKTIYNAMLEEGISLEDILVKPREGLDLAPASRDLAAAEVILAQETGGEAVLSEILRKTKEKYDYILIDCPPSLGKLTVNALVAADEVIIPLTCSFLAIKPLGQLLDTIETVKQRLNPNLRICGVLLAKFDSRTLHAKEIVERIRRIFKDQVFNTVVSRSVRFEEAPVRGETILEYASNHKGASQYRQFAKEVENHG